MKINTLGLSTLVVTLLWANPSLAHHVMGGDIPVTFLHGFLSGLGHPIIGLDHLAFIVAVGLIASLHQNAYFSPFAFLAGTLGGIALQLKFVEIHLVEFAIAGSVVLLGALVIRAKHLRVFITISIFVVAGILHGYAYGENIVGAELTPLTAYLMGLLTIQYAIAVLVITFMGLIAKANNSVIPVRIMGGVVLGIGLAFMAENISNAAL